MEPEPQPAATTARKAEPVELHRAITMEEGFRVIASNCLAQVRGNEAGVRRGNDPESVHQMRVGLRRLRSALRLFSRWIAFPPPLQQELVWLGDQLGAARDADVLADSTLPKVTAACPQDPEARRLRRFASKTAAQSRRRAGSAVASARYSRLMLSAADWLEAPRWHDALDPPAPSALTQPLNQRARQILKRLHDRLRQRGKRLAQGTPEERHRVRIAAKNARYATEFFQSLRPARRVERYVRRLAALQDALGDLNDAAVADRLLHDIEAHHPEMAAGAAFARGYLCAATRHDLGGLAKLWRLLRAMHRP
jgi:CHAD domain-containing protein